MPTIRVTEKTEIDRPLDVVRAHYSDIRHHMINNVHPAYKVEVLAEDEHTCTFNQRSKFMGRDQLDVYVVERKPDGTVHSKATDGPAKGTEQFMSFRVLTEDRTEVSLTLAVPVQGVSALMAPLIRRLASRSLKTVLAEDRVDMEVKGYRR